MKKTTTANLNTIVKHIKEHGIETQSLKAINEELDQVADKLHTNTIQTLLLACILNSSFSNGGASVKQICTMLGCTNIEFLNFSNELDELVRRHMVNLNVAISAYSETAGYVIAKEVIEAIKNDKVFIEEPVTNLDAEEFFDRLAKLFHDHSQDILGSEDLKERIMELVLNNRQIVFCKSLSEYDICSLGSLEFLLFLFMCNNYVNIGSDTINIDQMMSFMGGLGRLRPTIMSIKHKRLSIQQKGLVEYGNDDGMSDTGSLSLADKVKEEFFTDLNIELDVRKQCPDLIMHSSIEEKDLFFNDDVWAQVRRLSEILEENNFKGIQARLEAAKMRKGFNCLFYGSPGTGKTETVYQLAKESGRDILQIDLSKLKSKWVGESEKSVRSVFKYYQWLVKHSNVAPILLFNEADGIFGIRARMAEHSVDKMNNTIQNIILQEMEKMEGIMIATTNLTENLDSAFERRFLYKVEFSLPCLQARALIWRSMMPSLSQDEADDLANLFQFTGGQIENIARKCAIDFILTNADPSLKSIKEMCGQEFIHTGKQKNKIGF